MIITVKTLSGQSAVVDAAPEQTIESILPRVREVLGISAEDTVDIFFKSKRLNANDLIQSLNYQQNEFLVVRVAKPNAAPGGEAAEPQYKPFMPVPQPEQYDRNVRELLNLGFDLDIVERALVHARNNPNVAAELIFANRVPPRAALQGIPVRPPQEAVNRPPQEAPYYRGLTQMLSFDLGMAESQSHRMIRNFFLDNSVVAVQAIAETIRAINPNLLQQIQGNFAPFLTMIGVYSQFTNNNLLFPAMSRIQRALSSYNQDQSDAVRRLLSIDDDLTVVIPVYENSGRNENLAAGILRSGINVGRNSNPPPTHT